jgi:hypothetical protein
VLTQAVDRMAVAVAAHRQMAGRAGT